MTKKAYIFPGQGAQFVGMGKDLYDSSDKAKAMFEQANEILGFRITDLMFSGTDEDLRQTKVTQPAVFLHSVVAAVAAETVETTVSGTRSTVHGTRWDESETDGDGAKHRSPFTVHRSPDMVAGHSLGEFSALVVAKALSFEDGLRLVAARANAMQKACEQNPGTMAAILGLEDEVVEEICKQISGTRYRVHGTGCDQSETDGDGAKHRSPFTVHRSPMSEANIVVPANYNSPGQLVISGTRAGVEMACEQLKQAGAKRALPLNVGGAFHSPLMQPAADELKHAIEQTTFNTPICPIYQNVDAQPHTDPAEIKNNLILQLTAPVKWTQIVRNMADAGAEFTEFGPGNVLMGLVGKIVK